MKLTDIVPQKLSEVSDQELFRIWETFSYLIKNPKANREEIINRGTFIFNELISRDLEIEKNDLKSDIEERKKQKESENQDFSEAIRPPFGSPGGKRYMADRLVRMFPEHKVYVEPFVGAGGVFYKKKKVEGVQEIINDKDKDIIFCFKTIQNLTDVQWAELKKMDWTASKSGFAKAKKSLESSTGLKRFRDFVYLKQFSDLSELKSYDDRDNGKTWAGISNLMRLKNRLKDVTILNQDYRDVIKKYDSKDTFFYIDPPYPHAALNWKFMPTEAEVEAAMKLIKGNFLLSYELTKAFKDFKKKTISLWAIGNPGQHHQGKFKTEQLIMNYESKRNTRYMESFDLDGKGWLDIFHEHFVANGYSENWLKSNDTEKYEKIREAVIDFDLAYNDNWIKDIVGYAKYKKYNHISASLNIILNEQQDPYLKYPNENLTYQCVFQHHYRSGKIDPKAEKKATSVHTDLRMENLEKKFLIGFTILDQMPELIDEEISTYDQALKWDKDKDAFKIDWNTGECKKRIKKATDKSVNVNLVVIKKGTIPNEWLTVKGVVEPGTPGATNLGPGVFTILDKGSVEYLTQKSYSHEYIFHCDKIDYRLVFRKITLQQQEAIQDPFIKLVFLNNLFESSLDEIFQEALDNPQKILESLDLSLEAEIVPAKIGALGKDQTGWIVIKPIEQMPYVLSRGAIEKNFIPPKDISALTKEIRKQITEEFQYWKKDSEKERVEIRNALYEAMKKKEVNIKIKESWLQEIENIFDYDPTSITTRSLQNDYRLCTSWYSTKKRGGNIKYSSEQIESISKKIYNELKIRHIEFNPDNMKATSKELFDKISESKHRRDQCMECSEPPTVEVLWANGHGHAWWCDKHFKEWSKEHKDDIDYIKKVKDGEASEKFSDNTNPNIKESETNKFALHHKWFKEKLGSKYGNSKEHWVLRLDLNKDELTNFVLEHNPLKQDKSFAYINKSNGNKSWLERGEEIERIEPGQPGNPTKNTSCWIQLLDSGDIVVLENTDQIKKIEFKGKKLKGVWILKRESPKSEWWEISRSETS